jgi:hypothetical protein
MDQVRHVFPMHGFAPRASTMKCTQQYRMSGSSRDTKWFPGCVGDMGSCPMRSSVDCGMDRLDQDGCGGRLFYYVGRFKSAPGEKSH